MCIKSQSTFKQQIFVWEYLLPGKFTRSSSLKSTSNWQISSVKIHSGENQITTRGGVLELERKNSPCLYFPDQIPVWVWPSDPNTPSCSLDNTGLCLYDSCLVTSAENSKQPVPQTLFFRTLTLLTMLKLVLIIRKAWLSEVKQISVHWFL